MHFLALSPKGMRNTHLSQPVEAESVRASQGSTGAGHDGLWTARMAAAYCGFQSPVTILRAFRRGELPGYKLGLRAVRFDPRAVMRWIEAASIATKEGAR